MRARLCRPSKLEYLMRDPLDSKPLSWREALLLGLVLVLALGIRTAWLAEYSAGPEYRHPLYDPEYNAYWARGLATHDWTPPEGVSDPEIRTTPYGRPPGYPFFLAGVYTLFGVNDWAPRLVQTLLGTVNILLLYTLARVLFGPLAALLSSLLMALCWAFPYYEAQLTYPAVVVFLLLLAMRCVAAWARRPRITLAFALGLLLGLFALFRPNGLLFLPVLILWMFWTANRRALMRRTLPSVLLLLFGVAMALAPVFIRNYRVAHDFTFISSYGGLNFYVGNNPEASLVEPRLPELKELVGVENWSCFDYPAIVRGLARKLGRDQISFSEANRWFYQQAYAFIRENPARFLQNTARKALLFWGPKEVTNDTVPELDRKNSVLLRLLPPFAFDMALFLAGIVCFCAVWRKNRHVNLRPGGREGAVAVLLFILTYFLSVLPYFIAGRYRIPVLPFMIVFGGYGLARLLQWLRARRMKYAAAYLLLLAGAGALASWNAPGYEPSAGTWHLRRALAWSADGRDENAMDAYRQALENGADAALVNINMGRIRARQGDSEGAVAHYEKALQADPGNSVAQNNLGYELYRLGRTQEAEKHYRAAITANPLSALPHVNLGLALHDAGDAYGAVTEFRKALELDPNNAGAAYNLGRTLAALDEYKDAFDAYQKAIAIKPDFVEAHNNLGLLLKDDAAIACFRKAVEINPSFTLAWNNLGNTLLEKGDMEGAAKAYNSAIGHNPKDPFAYYNLGRVCEAQARPEDAAVHYAKSVEVAPTFAAGWNNLGFLRERQGNAEEAGRMYRKAIEANPNFAPGHTNLGRILCAQNRPTEAAEQFEAALKLIPVKAAEARKEIEDLRANCTPSPTS